MKVNIKIDHAELEELFNLVKEDYFNPKLINIRKAIEEAQRNLEKYNNNQKML